MIKKLLKLLMAIAQNVWNTKGKKEEKEEILKERYRMELKLVREKFYKDSTIGKLYVDGQFECYTLEDEVREVKVPGETAIPTGTYKVIIDYSNRFKCLMPLLLDVPGFTGIRIHSGNTDKDTDGCILVGATVLQENFVGDSRVAFNKLFGKLKSVFDLGEEITITIE